MNTIYHTVNIFNEGRYVMSLDFNNKADAVRDMALWQLDGYGTELLSLSTANIFDTAPDNYNPDVERVAY